MDVLTGPILAATWVLTAFLLAACLLAIVFARRPFLGIPQHWGLQLWWLALLGMLPALWLRDWAAFALCAAIAGYWSLRLFRARAQGDKETGAPLLRIVFANLLHENTGHDRAAETLGALEADVLVLCEAKPAARAAFRRLETRLPHALDTCVEDGIYGLVILSRFPLTERSRGDGAGAAPRHLAADLALEDGPISLVAIHPTNPLRFSRACRVPGEFESVARLCRDSRAELILIGDCNAAGWSHWLRRLEAATGLGNDRALRPSWPVWLPAPLRLPLDHLWVRGRLALRAARLGPAFGSDHLPVVAEIGRRNGPDSALARPAAKH